MLYIILIEPEHPGNIGAVARAMNNFGFTNLVMINPKVEIDAEARCRAKHAQKVLDNAIITDFSFLDKMDVLVATTARLGSEYNIPRIPLPASEMASKIDPNLDTAIIFGREGSGLTNEEIQKCDLVSTIPTYVDYPTLNLSHAVSIVLYELFLATEKPKTRFSPASREYKDNIMTKLDSLLSKLDFKTEDKRMTQVKAWKKILGKAQITKREAFVIFGLFKRIDEKIK